MAEFEVLPSLDGVPPAAWDALCGANNPFVEHAFLSSLERAGCVGPSACGWRPRHLVWRDGTRLRGAMPLYEKTDSFGEYIFDWAWAEGAQRAGLPYYPKWVCAVPFTPVTGPRLLLAPDSEAGDGRRLAAAAWRLAEASGASGLHVLFCDDHALPALAEAGLMARCAYQFHWRRQAAWQSFADFLAGLRAPARKAVRRERETAARHGLQIRMTPGSQLGDVEWDALYTFYCSTIADKHAIPYLTRAFFAELRRRAAHRVVAALAYDTQEPVAGALFFHKGAHLYGRYWGCIRPYDALHFELCYYAPIEWALAHGITLFEAGAQGEHKLKRGLLPSPCHSAHRLRHPGLSDAVQHYIAAEATALRREMQELQTHTPFARGP